MRRADRRLLLPALAAWGSAALATGTSGGVRVLLAAVAGVLALLAVRWGSRGGGGEHRARWGHPAPTLALAALAIGAVLASVAAQDAVRRSPAVLDAIARGPADLELRVDTPPRTAARGSDGEGRVWFAATVVRVGEAPARSPIRVLAPAAEWSGLAPGQRLTTTAALRATAAGERAVAFAIAEGPPHTGTARPPPALELAARVRADLRTAAESLPPHAQLLPGIAVGDDDGVPGYLADAMAATSLGHLLAVSGAHVAIVLGLVLALTGGAGVGVRVGVGGAVLAGLVLLVGPEASVIRAAGMGVVLLIAQGLGRRGQALAALGCAVVVLVVVDPWLATSLGFALSVSATAGIVLGSGPLTNAIAPRLGRGAPLAPALAVPLAAQLACLPVLLMVDPGIATYAVPANALVAPVIPGITLLGLGAAMLAGVWPGGAQALLWAATPGTWWIEQVSTRLAGAPLARLPWPAGWVGLALAAAICAVGWWARSWLRTRALALTAGALCLVLTAVALPATRDTVGSVARSAWGGHGVPAGWGVVACDVGQGTAVLVALEPGAAVLLDAGPPDAGIAQCLRAAGVNRIVALVLSHADLDHVGGLGDVLATVPVERAFLPAVADERLDPVRQQLGAADVVVVDLLVPDAATAAPVIELGGGALVEVLWPTERAIALRGPPAAAAANGLSLAVVVRTATVSLLAVGDLGADSQAGLLRAETTAQLLAAPDPIDVLVAPHHGSPDADPEFLAALSGRVTLVTVGAENRYGHPAPWVLDALTASGSQVLRTDTCGTVSVRRTRSGLLAATRCPGVPDAAAGPPGPGEVG